MAATIFGLTLGGEAARKRETANIYASKYPLSGDIAQVRENLGKATIELTELKNQKPKKAGEKRVQKRNITALSSWIVKLENSIKDAKTGMGGVSNNFTFAPPTAATLLGKNAYNKPMPQVASDKNLDVIKTDRRVAPKETIAEQVVDTTDGGQPQMAAQGDYPPPQGVQGINYGKWIGLGAIGVGVVALAYYIMNKKK